MGGKEAQGHRIEDSQITKTPVVRDVVDLGKTRQGKPVETQSLDRQVESPYETSFLLNGRPVRW